MARPRARTFTRGPRSATDWSASTPLAAYITLAGTSAILDQIFIPVPGGETVLRTRGIFTYMSDQAAANENVIGAIGIGVVSEQAATVGITAVPHPSTDASWGGWLFHSYFGERVQFVSAVGVLSGSSFAQHIVIDSKAMRKVGEDYRLVMVVENTSNKGMQYGLQTRILSKIH